MKKTSVETTKRFISKIDIRSDDECWPWKAAKDRKGYGRFMLYGHTELAHRIAYFIRHGKLPCYNGKGIKLLVCHHCDNPACCNPAHLFLGTSKNNTDDAISKGRINMLGENNSKAVLTKEQVYQIRLMLTKRIPQKKIANCYNITQSNVSKISTGKSWSPLNEPTRVKLEV